MRPLDRLPSIKLKLGVVIVAAVLFTVVAVSAGQRAGLSVVASGLVAVIAALLHRLALTPHVVYGRRRLLQEVWGYREGAGERTVDSHIRALRRKVGSASHRRRTASSRSCARRASSAATGMTRCSRTSSRRTGWRSRIGGSCSTTTSPYRALAATIARWLSPASQRSGSFQRPIRSWA